MSIFDRLGKAFGNTEELNVDDYMNVEEMSEVDVLHEPADFYVKPISLQQESDLPAIQEELNNKNIILLDISEMAKRPNTLKGVVDKLKEFVKKRDGDIARIDETRILITPPKVKIIKKRMPKKPMR